MVARLTDAPELTGMVANADVLEMYSTTKGPVKVKADYADLVKVGITPNPTNAAAPWGIPGVISSNGDASTAAHNGGNVMYGSTFWVASPITVTAIAVGVTTAQAATVRLGIARLGADLAPLTTVLDAGTVDVSTTGLKSITGLTTVLGPGYYASLDAASTNGVTFLRILAQTLDLRGPPMDNVTTIYSYQVGFSYVGAVTPAISGFPATYTGGWNVQSSSSAAGQVHTVVMRWTEA